MGRSAHFVGITVLAVFFPSIFEFFFTLSKKQTKKKKKIVKVVPKATGHHRPAKRLNLQAGQIRSKVDDFSTFLCRPVLMAFQKPGRHKKKCADRPIWPSPYLATLFNFAFFPFKEEPDHWQFRAVTKFHFGPSSKIN